MNVLWITNTIFPAPSKVLGIPAPVFGGWIYAMVMQVAASPNIRLAVATAYSGNKLETYDIDGVIYYLIPAKSITVYQKDIESYWRMVCNEFKPEVVHIHGTEYPPGLACMRACPGLKYVVSIQGLVEVISRYYYGGISTWDILKYITFRDIVRADTLFHGKRAFERRGQFEKEYIRKASIVSGRTSWDYAHVKSINPAVHYHFCNRTLRDSFYTAKKWDINNKTDFTIFLSQAGYPIKGLHQVLKAVALLKAEFPFVNVRVAGQNIITNSSFLEKIKLSGYGAYILSLLRRFNLRDKIQFTGPLTEDQMVAEYRNSHLFICPSSIENSPNSIGEAQLLGVPTIGSYVGGVPDMIEHSETGLLYRFEEVEMLAVHIRRIFTDTRLAMHLSKNGIKAAEKRHDQIENLKKTIDIYRVIVK